jgi:hypothetical protein
MVAAAMAIGALLAGLMATAFIASFMFETSPLEVPVLWIGDGVSVLAAVIVYRSSLRS